MSEEKPRISRLTAILLQLQSGRLITSSMLSKKFDISVRTVYRDIRTLEKSGVPIITEEGKGYRLMKGYQLPPVMFTEEEANALITAEQLILKNKDASFVRHYQDAIVKIKSILKDSQKQKTDLLSERIYFMNNNQKERTSNYLMQIQSSITSFQILEIEYNSLADKFTKRKIEPFAIYSTNDNWLLIAYCRLRTSFRSFRIDCIQKITVTDELFESHNMTLEEFYKKEYAKYYP